MTLNCPKTVIRHLETPRGLRSPYAKCDVSVDLVADLCYRFGRSFPYLFGAKFCDDDVELIVWPGYL